MTEKEKMIAGEWYDANYDKELLEIRLKAEQYCYDFNNARPQSVEQLESLKKILGTEIPQGVTILAPVYFDYGSNTTFGENTIVNHGCYFMDGATISIGSHVFIGPFCGFYTANHAMDYANRNKGLEKALPIKVGNNCWFGANVSVMPGVAIGNGCVIAAGSVVTKDIPDNTLVAGVPATVKKIIEQSTYPDAERRGIKPSARINFNVTEVTMDLEFRKITEFPRGTLAALLKDGYSFDPMFAHYWQKQWQEFDDFFYDNPHIAEKYGFITVLDNEPIGLVSWDPRKLPELAEVGHNCIVTKYKGNGYGRRQMQEAVNRIIAQGAKRIVVWTNEKLIAAQRTYESVGFRFVEKSKETICPECAGQRIHYEIIVR